MSRWLAVGALFAMITSTNAWGQTRTGIYVIRHDGSDPRRLAKMEGYDWHGSPAWSNDGKRIAFDATPGNRRTENCHIFVIDADGKNLKDLGLGSVPRWSPDDKQILFFQHNLSGEKPGLYVMAANGEGRQWLSEGERARWSPDGTKILHTAVTPDSPGLWVYDTITEQRERIAGPGFQRIIGGDWSPDGTRAVFIGTRNDSNELCIVDLDDEDNKFRVRLRGAVGWQPDWSPDGNSIVFWVKEGGSERLHVIDPNGDGPPTLLKNQGDWSFNTDPAWSPDGQFIAFTSDRPE